MIHRITFPIIHGLKVQQLCFKANNDSGFNKPDAILRDNIKVPVPTLIAYMQDVCNGDGVNVNFSIPMQDLESKYKKQAIEKIEELNQRAGKNGQVLNWIGFLPQEQLKRLDEIYSLADFMKQNGEKKLGVIGIGGSKHTIENILSLNNREEDVVFLSAVDPDSIDKFVKKLGDLKNASIMVASKSGTTLEPSVGFAAVEKIFIEKFKGDFIKEGCNEEDALQKAIKETAKHFVCITDKDKSKSKLREIADQKGYKCGIIHDECGGRFGAFDDHALTALAWAGMKKDDMKQMLESSIRAQKMFLSNDLFQNKAMQRAMFNTECVLKGKMNQHDYYFGDVFKGTALWNTQLKKESHKSIYRVSADLIGPEFLHNSTESDLNSENKSSFYTFNTVKNNNSDQHRALNALINGSYRAYSQKHPVSVIELKNLSPVTIGAFIELKHFETLYTGMMLRSYKFPERKNSVLPEVIQPSVNIYKDEVKKILSSK